VAESPPRRTFDPFPLAKPFLHLLDPERAHELTLRALEANVVPAQPRVDEPSIAIDLFGRRLDNPVGLAAGFDKNGRVFRRMYAQGFGFVEIGGVTPRPQRGNPRPRVFRVPEDAAVINNMGFPNDGAEAVVRRLGGERPPGMLGINLASNGDSPDPAEDFVGLVQRFSSYADYLTFDVSCPNSINGKVFLDPARLRDLMERLAAVDRGPMPPKLVAKLSPDVDDALLAQLVAVLLEAKIDGIVVSNTTVERPDTLRGDASMRGGLSGRPLFARSTAMLAQVAHITGGAVPLIGLGGIASGPQAYEKIRAGATAVQLYTGLIYAGTALVTRIKRELAVLLLRDGYATLSEAVGTARSVRKVSL
jgi:dihydroorotate dehydrogenase